MVDLTRIKYFQDKFFIRLDGFDLNKLYTFADDNTFSQQQAIYLHEYYHYLANLTTFYGARQFNCRFQDKVRLVTILLKKKGLDAFPLSKNTELDCKYELSYWKSLDDLFRLDDVDECLAEKVENSPQHKFKITRYSRKLWPLSLNYNGKTITGEHTYYQIDISGVPFVQHFFLANGMIDEFLSSSIDEFMFYHDLADNCDVLRAQSFYPYRTLDSMLEFFHIEGLSAKDKILLSYTALHGTNPIEMLILLLKRMKKDKGKSFKDDPETFLLQNRDKNEIQHFSLLIQYENDYIQECIEHGRKNLADTMILIYNLQCKAIEHLKEDFFFFIRPFMVDNPNSVEGRTLLLKLFRQIRLEMDEPILVQNRKMIAADTDTYKNHLAMQIAIYEIMDSLWVNRIATRLTKRKDRYDYPVSTPDNDKLMNLTDQRPLLQTWHVALNELGLYGEYLKEKEKLETD